MSLRGYVDQVTHYTVTGWAFDEENPDIAVHVIISVNGAPLGGVVADQFRDDLKKTLGANASGKHGFLFSFEPSLSLFKTNEVLVTFKKTTLPLPKGRKSLPSLADIPGGPKLPIPILVTAAGRSGTSLLMSRLASHDEIVVAGDFPFEIKMIQYYSLAFRTLVSEGERHRSTDPDTMASEKQRFHIGFNPFNHPRFWSVLGNQGMHDEFFLGTVPEIMRGGFRDLIARYYDLVRIRTKKNRTRYIAEKIHPDVTSRLVPRFLFGCVKEIVLIRDPRDLLCSYDSFWKFSGDQAIDSIVNSMRTMVSIREEKREDTIFIKFEDLVLRQFDTLKVIAAFLDADDTFRCDVSDDSSRFKSHGTTASPEASIGRWKNDLPQEQRDKCNQKFGAFIEIFDYEP